MADIEQGGIETSPIKGHENCNHGAEGHNGHAHDHGHSHGHDHGNGHGHQEHASSGHGQAPTHKKKKKSFIHNEAFGSFVVFFTVAMPTCCVVLEFFWFDKLLKDNAFEYTLQTFCLFGIYFMCNWSYYQSITIKNNPVTRPSPPPDNRDIDNIYKNADSCKSCNKWKPVRTHHCSICNQCTLKMDHHCPWVVNCVGLRNHRAFYLFSLYLMLGGWQYMWRSWCYFTVLYYSENFFQHHILFYAFWTFTSCVLYPTAILLLFLVSYHTMLMISNLTTLESMGGGSGGMCCMPTPKGQPLQTVNVFDRGCIANIAWFFEYSLFTWWMPFENLYENDGSFYPVNPPCNFSEIAAFSKQQINMDEQLDLESIKENFKEFVEQTRLKYKGKRININGRVIEI